MSSYVNTAKHRRLVGQLFSVSFEDGSAKLEVPGFTYRSHDFASYSLHDVLRGIIEVRNGIVQCGIELNTMLGVQVEVD